jgi:hypothetical protein
MTCSNDVGDFIELLILQLSYSDLSENFNTKSVSYELRFELKEVQSTLE